MANARAGARMTKSFHDRCTLTTVVISSKEFKGSPAMLASGGDKRLSVKVV
jgi:hypothetical protein